MSDQKFFDAPSPLNDRPTRREALDDYCSNLEDEVAKLTAAVSSNDARRARRAFLEIKGWLDAIDDNLCRRDPDTGERFDITSEDA